MSTVNDDVRDLFSYLQTRDESALSVAMSNWYEGGVRRLYVHRAETVQRVAACKLYSTLFEYDGTPRPQLFESVPFKKLFGRRMPEGEDDDTLRSGRVLVDPAALPGAVSSFDELRECVLGTLLTVLRREMDVEEIGVVTEQLIIRGAGRIEAQQTHFDGVLSKAGHTSTVSVIVALSPQNSTLFHSYIDAVNFPSSVFFAPTLMPGDFTSFDPNKVSHEGYLSGTGGDGTLTVPAMFYLVYVNQSKTEVEHTYVQSSEVTNYPHTIITDLLDTPSIVWCKSCSRELLPSMALQYMMCSQCGDVDYIPVMCEVCSRLRPVSVPCEMWNEALAKHGPNSVVGYLARSVLAAIPECKHVATSTAEFSSRSHFCSHQSNVWNTFPANRTVELVFNIAELRSAAKWLLSLHQSNVLVIDKVRVRVPTAVNDLFSLVEVLLKSDDEVCPRQHTVIMTVLCGIGTECSTSTQDSDVNGLLIRDSNEIALTSVSHRVTALRRLSCAPSAQDLEALSMAWFRRDKRSKFRCIGHGSQECSWDRVPKVSDDVDDEVKRRWTLMMSISCSLR